MRELIKVFKAISDETRIRIMKLLLERKSLCVCEIMQSLNISQTCASKNLRILRDAELVLDKKKGTWVHYSVNRKMTNSYIRGLMELLKQLLNEDKIVLEDRKRLGKAVKLGNK